MFNYINCCRPILPGLTQLRGSAEQKHGLGLGRKAGHPGCLSTSHQSQSWCEAELLTFGPLKNLPPLCGVFFLRNPGYFDVVDCLIHVHVDFQLDFQPFNAASDGGPLVGWTQQGNVALRYPRLCCKERNRDVAIGIG